MVNLYCWTVGHPSVTGKGFSLRIPLNNNNRVTKHLKNHLLLGDWSGGEGATVLNDPNESRLVLNDLLGTIISALIPSYCFRQSRRLEEVEGRGGDFA